MQVSNARAPRTEEARLIQEVMDNLRRVFQVINDHSKQAQSTTGLTGPQLWALKVLAGHAPLRVTDLAARMYLHPSTVVGILHRLEVKNLVERRRLATDRRVVHVALTAAGKVFVLRIPPVAQSALLAGLESLSRSELRTVGEGLRLQVKILGAQELPPQLLLSREVNVPACEPEAGGGCSPGSDAASGERSPEARCRRPGHRTAREAR